MIKVYTIESIFEMDMIKDALDKEGITYSLKEHKDTAYDGLFILQKGYATLFAEEKDKPAILEIIERISSLAHADNRED